MTDEREAYAAWLAGVEASGRTPELDEYLRWEEFDDNVPWRLGSGHLVNLLDQAVEQRDAVAVTAERMTAYARAADLKLRAIAEVLDQSWFADRVVPRMIGAEEMQQVAAIRSIMDWRPVVADRGGVVDLDQYFDGSADASYTWSGAAPFAEQTEPVVQESQQEDTGRSGVSETP